MGKRSGLELREAHYERFLGPMSGPVMHSTDEQPVHIDIYQYAPTDDRPWWTLITGGMSDRRQPIPEDVQDIGVRAELLMHVREPRNWMFSVLKGLAEMPFQDDTFLHWGHTVPNGMPMTARPSELTSYLLLPPYFEGPDFDTFELDGDRVDFLWVVPITEQEREYAIEHGSQALEAIFEEHKLDPVVDEDRGSLV